MSRRPITREVSPCALTKLTALRRLMAHAINASLEASSEAMDARLPVKKQEALHSAGALLLDAQDIINKVASK